MKKIAIEKKHLPYVIGGAVLGVALVGSLTYLLIKRRKNK